MSEQAIEHTGDQPVLSEPFPAVSLTPVGLDPHRLLLAGIDTSHKPVYSILEIAKCFFGKTAHWVRWREGKGYFDIESRDPATGQMVSETLGSRSASGARKYSLSDIEKMTHALAVRSAIDGETAVNILTAVHAIARVYGYLPTDLPVQTPDEPMRVEDQRVRDLLTRWEAESPIPGTVDDVTISIEDYRLVTELLSA